MSGSGDADRMINLNLMNGYHNNSPREPSPEQQNNEDELNFNQMDENNNFREKSSREASRITGTVKWFNAKNGYGFVTRHDTGEDVFVHFTAISRKNPRHSMKSLGDGEVVEFNIVAVNVTAPGGRPVRGNPYVSYIPIRRNDSFAAGDPGMFLPMRRYPRPVDYGNSRIPRWTPIYRNCNY